MFQAAFTALGLLTRLPTPPVAAPNLAKSQIFYPWVGLLIGAVQFSLARHLPMPPVITALVITAANAMLTGALHLDGWADCFDGLGGGRGDRQRMHAIMHDPRVGAHGAAALVLLLLTQVAALTLLVEKRSLWPLLYAPAVARWCVVPLMQAVRTVRREGLAAAFTAENRWSYAALATAPMLAAVAAVPDIRVASLISVLAAWSLAAWMFHRLGGLTGDVYGACIELAQVTFYLTAL